MEHAQRNNSRYFQRAGRRTLTDFSGAHIITLFRLTPRAESGRLEHSSPNPAAFGSYRSSTIGVGRPRKHARSNPHVQEVSNDRILTSRTANSL